MTEVLIEFDIPSRTVPASVVEIWYETALSTGDIKGATGFALSDKINALEEAGFVKAKRIND